jgi:small subunit ribosomal protein S3
MGQKVNPVGMRVGVNRDWTSRWYANDQEYHVFLNQDIKIRELLTKECKEASLSHIDIERNKTDNIVNIAIFVVRVSLIVGENGANVMKLKEKVAKLLPAGTEIKISVVEVKNPDLDANIVAQEIAKQLEERASFRTAQKKAIQRVRKAGAKGIKTSVSGRLGGADIARAEGYREGVIPLHTLRSDIDYACVHAATQYGRLGVKVWICRGEIRPELAKKNNEKGE